MTERRTEQNDESNPTGAMLVVGASPTVTAQDRLFHRVASELEQLGYECVQIEILNQRQKVLRIFVDRPQNVGVSIEDCVKVTKALDAPLEASSEILEIFGTAPYELEVSSPGVDRPLRLSKDYRKFSGREVKLSTFRPLNAEEMENASYQERNPRQKNFLGVLKDTQGDEPESARIALEISGETVWIPLRLIAKANLEPKFDFDAQERP